MVHRDKPTLLYCGHHKCASTWIEDISFYVCSELRLRYDILYEAKDFNYDLQGYINKEKLDFVCYANADYEYVKQVKNYIGFHVVRDPRDVVVSAYFSHLHSHSTDAWKELIDYREKLKSLDQHHGLFAEIDFREQQFKEMMSWPEKDANIIELKMEDLTLDAYKIYVQLFDFLGLLDTGRYGASKRFSYLFHKIVRKLEKQSSINLMSPLKKLPVERLLGIIWEHEFAKVSGGRKAGQEDIKNHYRKGVAGDWLNYLTKEHVAYFKAKYDEVLLKYGYESASNWDEKYEIVN